jgi:hypothetical protein
MRNNAFVHRASRENKDSSDFGSGFHRSGEVAGTKRTPCVRRRGATEMPDDKAWRKAARVVEAQAMPRHNEATQRAAIQKIELSTGEETGRRKLVHEELRSGRFLAFDRCGDVKEVNVMA